MVAGNNAFNKEEIVMFENILAAFGPNNITAKQVSVFRPGMQQQERANYTVWRPMPYISRTESGLDLTGKFKALTQLSVPASIDFTESVPWEMNAYQLNDPQQRDRKAQSAAQALSAKVDNAIATLVGQTGGMVVASANPASGYRDIARFETRMLDEDINISTPRTCILNGQDWEGLAENLANRETMQGKPTSAYERSYVGPVAGFDTFRTSFNKTLPAAAGGVTTTAGGAQSHVPVATQTNAINGGESNVDNRGMDLTVDNTTGVAVGDAFTVPGVFVVSAIHKEERAALRTFRVVEVKDATTLHIYPAPVFGGGGTQAEIEYANVSAPIPDATPLTWINTTKAPVNTFWTGDSIELSEGSLAIPPEDMAGVAVTRMSTDSGLELVFAKGGDVGTLIAQYRVTIFFGATNLNPMMNGIGIFDQ